MPAIFGALADLVLILHLGFILYVVAGGLLLRHRPQTVWLHLPALFWGLLVTIGDWQCPLTPLEQELRRRSGATPYSEGFIEHYLLPILYPDWLQPPTRIGLGLFVIAVNLAIYTGVLCRRRSAKENERDSMKRLLLLLGTLLVCFGSPQPVQALTGRDVEYREGATLLKGYLVEDSARAGRKPGVLVVPEWWGLNDYARRRADMLAAAGYVALAVDMYGSGRVADHPKDAAAFAAETMTDPAVAERRFVAALEFLRRQPGVDPERIAAIGYCYGGGVVLHMARSGVDLAGVISYHGSLAPKRAVSPGSIRSDILVFNGEADPMVPPLQVKTFKEEMTAARARFRYVGYPGALHAFTNSEADALAARFQLPIAYDAAADRDSWQQSLGFLKEIFAKPR